MGSQRDGSNWATNFHFHLPVLWHYTVLQAATHLGLCSLFLEKEMATHSSVLAWRILWTEEPGGLLSIGSHRVRHDWRDLAAAAAVHRNSLQAWTNAFLHLCLGWLICALDSSKNLGPRYPDLGAWRKKTPWLQLSAIPLSYLEILFSE